MSYTHYWKIPKYPLPKKQWTAAVKDFRELTDVFHGTLRSHLIAWEETDPDKPPEVTNNLIRFNGIGEKGHETFYFSRTKEEDSPVWFCKTARKPYDALVVAALCILKKHFGNRIRVSSDGDWKTEWLNGAWEGTQSGVALVKTYLRYSDEDLAEIAADITRR